MENLILLLLFLVFIILISIWTFNNKKKNDKELEHFNDNKDKE